jgi:hypothetical protein
MVDEEMRPSGSAAAGFLRSLWRWCVWVTSIVGLLCTFAVWGWNGLTLSAFTCAVFAGVVGACVWAGSGRSDAVRAVRLIVVGALLLTASLGLLAVFHVVGFVVVVLLAVLSPGLAAGIRQWTGQEKAPGANPAAVGIVVPTPRDDLLEPRVVLRLPRDVAGVNDEALCLAWRRSYMLLRMAGSTSEHLSVVEERTRILDELARRSPEALEAWWTAGGRASGNPLPFLGGHRSQTDPGLG